MRERERERETPRVAPSCLAPRDSGGGMGMVVPANKVNDSGGGYVGTCVRIKGLGFRV